MNGQEKVDKLHDKMIQDYIIWLKESGEMPEEEINGFVLRNHSAIIEATVKQILEELKKEN